jgi:hypothetical protein
VAVDDGRSPYAVVVIVCSVSSTPSSMVTVSPLQYACTVVVAGSPPVARRKSTTMSRSVIMPGSLLSSQQMGRSSHRGLSSSPPRR